MLPAVGWAEARRVARNYDTSGETLDGDVARGCDDVRFGGRVAVEMTTEPVTGTNPEGQPTNDDE